MQAIATSTNADPHLYAISTPSNSEAETTIFNYWCNQITQQKNLSVCVERVSFSVQSVVVSKQWIPFKGRVIRKISAKPFEVTKPTITFVNTALSIKGNFSNGKAMLNEVSAGGHCVIEIQLSHADWRRFLKNKISGSVLSVDESRRIVTISPSTLCSIHYR